MNHSDHVRLLEKGVSETGGVWADFGAGEGAFTLALADLLGSQGKIYAVDKDASALRTQQVAMRSSFPDMQVEYRTADFSRLLDLSPLDGIVMANALHFQRHKEGVLSLVRGYLKPTGRLLLVEYNADQGNPWVPYPLSYPTWEALARRCGFAGTRLLAVHPSRFLREIYSAISLNSEGAR